MTWCRAAAGLVFVIKKNVSGPSHATPHHHLESMARRKEPTPPWMPPYSASVGRTQWGGQNKVASRAHSRVRGWARKGWWGVNDWYNTLFGHTASTPPSVHTGSSIRQEWPRWTPRTGLSWQGCLLLSAQSQRWLPVVFCPMTPLNPSCEVCSTCGREVVQPYDQLALDSCFLRCLATSLPGPAGGSVCLRAVPSALCLGLYFLLKVCASLSALACPGAAWASAVQVQRGGHVGYTKGHWSSRCSSSQSWSVHIPGPGVARLALPEATRLGVCLVSPHVLTESLCVSVSCSPLLMRTPVRLGEKATSRTVTLGSGVRVHHVDLSEHSSAYPVTPWDWLRPCLKVATARS